MPIFQGKQVKVILFVCEAEMYVDYVQGLFCTDGIIISNKKKRITVLYIHLKILFFREIFRHIDTN